MAERAPGVQVIEADIPSLGTDVEDTYPIGEVEYAGVVTSVSYTPQADITGANTNYRALNLINKGQDGNGSTVIATIDFTSGVNAADFDERALTLSATLANRNVAVGDQLALASTTPGTGIADPGGLLRVEISRGAGNQ